ncbi:3-dehydroquinate synthase [Nostoc sp. 106C]|uniref:3-dehydroquinate synthase n=1 Tax=Nostoc sp. 106C TaxID=1932667 RepID=UPI000A3BE872|nr:3-dehydroquinate synthase [Nostoc sp. 106C]OUL18198.1 3-dehydroquinate synthase [Nostoc sp. 106C]OUL24317.1 3-dehydroquinate synthase [Nostoc sp. RF31YmG]
MLITHKPSVQLQSIQQSVCVNFNYDVHFTNGLFQLDNPLLAQVIAADGDLNPKKVLAIVDGGLLKHQHGLMNQISVYAQFYADIITLIDEPIIVPGGEIVKNEARFVEQIHQLIDADGLCRHSYVLGIGGGALLDMVGYAAATAHRGIRLLRVPTTVLAQNDSGVGVKNGINAFGKKNFLGTFMPPYAVLNDFDFLTSLDDRDWRSGIAEAVKVGLIKDADFFQFILTHADKLAARDLKAMEKLIYRCAQLHLQHIATSGDPFEKGSSRPLDFGHWAAHKLEHITDYKLRHGEAVAIGIALDSTYSYLTGLLSQLEWQRILGTLKRLGFTLYVSALTEQLHQPDHPHHLFRGITEFREHLGGKLSITLLQGIGQGIEVHQVDLYVYKKAISMVQDWELSHSC